MEVIKAELAKVQQQGNCAEFLVLKQLDKSVTNRLEFLKTLFKSEWGIGVHTLDKYIVTIKETHKKILDQDKVKTFLGAELPQYQKDSVSASVNVEPL